MRKEYDIIRITNETKFIIVYQYPQERVFFIGITNTCEDAEQIIQEDMIATGGSRKHYGIIPCSENSTHPMAIEDVVIMQNDEKYEDIFDVFDRNDL